MTTKILFLDTETTGLDEKAEDGTTILAHEIHSIVELSGIVDIDGRMAKRFQFFARPKYNDPVDLESIEINGRTKEEVANFPTQMDLYRGFKEVLGEFVDPFNKEDKFWFVAYNAKFDNDFIRQLFKDFGDDYFGSWFWTPYIDIMQLVGLVAMTTNIRHLIPNMKLATIARYLGFETDEKNFHNGLYDVRICRQIYYKLTSE